MARSTRRESNKESFWRQMVDGHARSGLSVRDWCRRNALSEPSFYCRRRELAQRDTLNAGPMFVPLRRIDDTPGSANTSTRAAMPSGKTTFAPAESDDRAAGRIEIVLPGPRRVCLIGPVDRQTLADVLAVLTSEPRDPPIAACSGRCAHACGNGRCAEAGAC